MKKSPKYRRNQTCSCLFENAQTLEAPSKQGNPLEFISKMIDFEMFRTILESKLQTSERKSNAGRRPIDPVLMFKVRFVQRLYGLRDEQAEYQIKEMQVSLCRLAKEIQERKTRQSKRVREIVCGMTILTRSATKILMLAGQRRAEIHSTVIRTTQRCAVRLN